MSILFDLGLRAMRRDRAARQGVEPFLYRRALDDCLERLAIIDRHFDRALLVGCLDGAAGQLLARHAARVDVRDPSALLAENGGGEPIAEEQWTPALASYDLIVTLGTLDTINALQPVLRAMRVALAPGGLFIGAMSGGDTLPRLRAAMRAADLIEGGASPHVHPRIEPAALAPLLSEAGFVRPVVDVDRVSVRYKDMRDLVRDLRAMGGTNILDQRPRRGLGRAAFAAAIANFAAAAEDGRTGEIFEFLHFAAWAPERP
jgi:SAM-dependent methyltransferase